MQLIVYCSFTASQQATSTVGFSMFAEDGWHYPDEGEIISFPFVITNNGGHYDPINSMFTWPLNGTYYFTFNLYTSVLSNGELTNAYIQKDGVRLSEALCSNHGPDNIFLQCGTFVVIHCHLGQSVFVISANSDTHLNAIRMSSTFSGFLIHADVPQYYVGTG